MSKPNSASRCIDRAVQIHGALGVSREFHLERGWRDAGALKGEAPLKETLAAAMLAAAGWQGREEDGALFDPFCGAGTIAIEAAQIACGIASGSKRRFAIERLARSLPYTSGFAQPSA